MQLLEFDLKAFILGILLLLSGCFSSGRSAQAKVLEEEAIFKKYGDYPWLFISAEQKDELRFHLVIAVDSSRIIKAKPTGYKDVKLSMDKLLNGIRDIERIPVFIKVSNETNVVFSGYVTKILNEKGMNVLVPPPGMYQ
jgi:hypothetical protein